MFWGILESACLYVCPSVYLCVRMSACVKNTSFCQSAGGGIKSHSATALVFPVSPKHKSPSKYQCYRGLPPWYTMIHIGTGTTLFSKKLENCPHFLQK